MADRFPLIVDSVNNNIKELPSGDNLDLTGNNIVNVGNITTTGYIAGPASFTIDPAAVGDATGTLIILGNLQVEGTTTTINSTTIELDDKNIVLASGAANAAAADGAGITIDGASATLTYNSTPDAWSFNKNVGIGTASPATKLHLGGTAPLDSIIRQDSTVSGTNWEIGERAAGKWQIWEDDTDSVVATFTSNGNVGIGTNSPSVKLEVSDNIAIRGGSDRRITLGSSGTIGANDSNHLRADGTALKFNTAGGEYILEQNGSEAMRIDANGNLGLGVTPSAWSVLKGFQVGTASTTYDSNDLYFGTNFYYGGAGFNYINSDFACMYAQVDGSHRWSTAASGIAGNPISFSEAMRIDSSGNVGIGTISPQERVTISTTGTSQDAVLQLLGTNSNGGQSNGVKLRAVGAATGTGAGTLAFDIRRTSFAYEEAMRIDSSGNVGIGTISPSYTLEVSGDAVATQGMPIATESGTSRTFALTDIGNYIRTTSASATTVTIPPNSSVAFPIGAEIIVFQAGAGTVTFAAGSGVTINSKDGALSLSAQYAAATCKKVATDTWDLIGDLA